VKLAAATLLLALSFAPAVHADDVAGEDARLRARLAPDVAERVLAIVHDARASGLPTDPLVGRALEGASRHASGDDILTEIRRHAAALGAARGALGADAGQTEIAAGATALMAGVPADSLTRLRTVRPRGSLVVSLVVMCDFLARGVPMPTAAGTVIAAARAGTPDDAMMRMRQRVHDEIRRGVAPAGATREALTQLLRSGPARESSPPHRRSP